MRCITHPRQRAATIVVALALVAFLAVGGGCSASRAATTKPASNKAVGSGPASPKQLRVVDVQRMFAAFAQSESLDETRTQDSTATDAAADYFAFEYAAAVLARMPLTDPLSKSTRLMSPSLRRARIGEAVAAWDRIAAKSGTETAAAMVRHAELGGEQGDPPPTRAERLLGLFDAAWEASDFMLTPPYHRDPYSWDWTVESITIEGTSTAHVIYSAKTDPVTDPDPDSSGHRTWTFKDPAMRYERIWRFMWNAKLRRWQVADWVNRQEFLARMQANISDPADELMMKEGQPFYWLVD
jgi:hypothetical protein